MKYFDDGATRTSGRERGKGGGSFWEELNYHNTLCSNNLIIMIFKKNYIDFRNLKRKNVYLFKIIPNKFYQNCICLYYFRLKRTDGLKNGVCSIYWDVLELLKKICYWNKRMIKNFIKDLFGSSSHFHKK